MEKLSSKSKFACVGLVQGALIRLGIKRFKQLETFVFESFSNEKKFLEKGNYTQSGQEANKDITDNYIVNTTYKN